MVWLLFWVVWDRPGIINELSFVFLKHGVNVRNIIGNSRALMVDVDGDLDSLIPRLGSVGGLEFLGVINGPIVPLTFSQRHFIAAVKNVLSQMGTQHVERVLYRLGYEYARVLVSEIPLGDPLTTVRTYLSTATAYNRLTFKKLEVKGDELIVEFENPFDEELNTALTQGYIHGLTNTALTKLHTVRINKVDNAYISIARPYDQGNTIV